MKILISVLTLSLLVSCSSKKEANSNQTEVNPAVQTEKSVEAAPEFGGYCTFNLCYKKKKLVPGDKKYQLIYENKLYYFESEKCMKRFQKDIKGNLMKAHSRWRTLERMSNKGARD